MRKILTLLLSAALTVASAAPAAFAADASQIAYRELSDENYIFRVKGSSQRFLLLDTTDDKSSKYFIMGIDYYGQMAFDTLGSQKFDTTSAMNIAYKLNNSFITEGFKQSLTDRVYKLPQNVIDHIDFNHVWTTEGSGRVGLGAEKDYKSTCGIAVLSLEEMYKYQSKIGWRDNIVYNGKDSTNSHVWWLRTGSSNTNEMYTVKPNTPDVSKWTYLDETPQIRPVFYVDSDFFGEVPIDLETAGKYVREVFKPNFTAGELKKIYPESDLYNYLGYKSLVDTSVISATDGTKEITKLNGVSNISVNAEFSNNNVKSESGIAVMTYYNAYGEAIKTDSVSMLIAPGETRSCNLSLNFDSAPEQDDYVKITFVNRSKPYEHNNNCVKYYCE